MISIDALPSWIAPRIGDTELAAVDVVARRHAISDPTVLAAVGLVVMSQGLGHSCVDLERIGELIGGEADHTDADTIDPPPGADPLIAVLRGAPGLVRVIELGEPGSVEDARSDFRPLVLFGRLLYSQRQFIDERSVVDQLVRRSAPATTPVELSLVDLVVPRPSPDDQDARDAGDTGIANRAARSFMSRQVTVLTGGPGTGKTHTLTRCIALIVAARHATAGRTKVVVAAPTGKAATRAKELLDLFVADQIADPDGGLGLDADVLSKLSRIESMTIQRLLGSRDGKRTRFFHDASEPLDVDVLVVDEMSMVPTYLMARLLEAVKPGATILLVGDQAQLEAVESGSVLREIVDSTSGATAEWVFELRRVWRQSSDTDIGRLARHVRAGESGPAAAIVTSGGRGVVMHPVEAGTGPDGPILGGLIGEMRRARDLAMRTDAESHRIALSIVADNKVLCGPRKGRLGVADWNSAIGTAVTGRTSVDQSEPGTPLMVTVNSPRARLVNGDIGVVVNQLDESGSVVRRVCFDDGTSLRYLSPAELPPHEISFAMTIHKSQGSEYSNLVVVLPRRGSPLLNRELIYTAVTRAKKSLTIVGDAESVVEAIDSKSVRYSGIGAMLGNATSH